MRFSNAYAPASVCTPARKSIQIGKSPVRLGYTYNGNPLNISKRKSWANETSLADVLKGTNKNYITALFGKGIHEPVSSFGYDVVDDQHGTNDNQGNFFYNNGDTVGPEDLKQVFSLTEKSEKFIEKYAGKQPFFLMLSHYTVHGPITSTAAGLKKYQEKAAGLPKGDARTNKKQQEMAAMIESMDISVGRVLDALDKAGVRDKTYIIFTSDNGGWVSLTPHLLRGKKGNLFEGGLRVPMIVAGPNIPENSQCDVMLNHWDFLPTFHDLVGATEPLPENLDGGSLRSIFEQGNEGQIIRPEEAFIFHMPYARMPPVTAIRSGKYKLIRQLNTGEEILFDLDKDLSEKNNLAKLMPEVAARLSKELDAYLEKVGGEKIDDVFDAQYKNIASQMEDIKAKHEKLIQQSGDDQTKISALTKKRDKDLKRLQDFKLQKIDPARICTNFDGNPKGDYRKTSAAE
ncbi:sulfatase 1 precursor [Lentisphaera araneosa HTCC2155]|uniref:Sulfatase 1 n=1 Tax=Lentisphaera araneosa HTCC2155 TaxID=313628 RepID=A6DJK5_9BACT|nr:sulfatase [Lentisphaera araneosa]EDM28079.1 sulfatase 1 precursor [Lentisphaera araneosa HTCC2155]